MVNAHRLSHDMEELLARIAPDGLVMEERDGAGTVKATALAIPTFAERGRSQEAEDAARRLLDQRNATGGWDDPASTIYAIEALTALKLRGLTVDDLDSAIVTAVKTLRDQQTMEELEWELRLSRGLVLAGLARQDAPCIDAGLMRIRSALDRTSAWSEVLSTTLHGLLALVDLYTITNDDATGELIESRVNDLKLAQLDACASGQDTGVICRAGIVLAKLGKADAAREAYERAFKQAPNPAELTTDDLKHRVELGARLSVLNADQPARSKPAEEEAKTPAPAPARLPEEQVGTEGGLLVEDLPALEDGLVSPAVTAVIVQLDPDADLETTLSALDRQSRPVDEVVVVHAGCQPRGAGETPGSRIDLYPEATVASGRQVQLGLEAARGERIWLLPAGVTPTPETLATLFLGASDGEATHLSAYDGHLSKALTELRIQPAIRPEHVLVSRASLKTTAKTARWRGNRPWWPLFAENLLHASWNEVIHPDLDASDAAAHDSAPNAGLLEELPAFYRAFPSQDPEERRVRATTLDERRAEVYSTLRSVSKPLVSIVVDDRAGKDEFQRCLQALIEHTQAIPFEVIAVLRPALAGEVAESLDHLGVLLIEADDSLPADRLRTIGADKAQGRYIAFIGSDVDVQANWLQALLHAAQEDGAGVASGLIQHTQGTVLHAGVAFDRQGRPYRLHRGASTLVKHIHSRRMFQSVAGDAMLVRRNLWQRLGGFHAEFGAELSAIDFCLRARRNGERVVYEPKARFTSTRVVSQPSDKEWEHWLTMHTGRISPDLEQYAHLDGYRVLDENGKPRLVPFGVKHEQTGEGDRAMKKAEHQLHEQPAGGEKAPVSQRGESLLDLLARAETLIKDGRFDIAEEALIKGKQQVNGNVHSRVMYWTLLGDARFRLNRPEEAYTCYRKAVDDDPSSERAWIGIGTYHLVKDELDEATGIFSRVIELNPANMRGYLGMANTLLKRGNSVEALGYFQKAAEFEPGYRPAIVGIVAAAVQAEKMDAAEPSLERYLEEHPDDVEARFHLAAILFGSQHLDRARDEAVKVLEARPDHKGALELLTHLPGEPSQS